MPDRVFVPYRPYQTVAQMLVEDPRCSELNPLFERVEQPGIGCTLTPGSPIDFSAAPRQRVQPAPRLGQHTHDILRSVLGLSDPEIGALQKSGIVAGPTKEA